MHRKDHPLYEVWNSMRARCNTVTHKRYSDYGGRGIKVCPEWDEFWVFVEDMGERPEGTTLDRIENDGDYEPGNCAWRTPKDQNHNRRFFAMVWDSRPMRCIRQLPSGKWNVRIKTLPNTRPSFTFLTLEEAIDFRNQTEYEREFQRALGLSH